MNAVNRRAPGFGALVVLAWATAAGGVARADDPPGPPHPVSAWAAGPFEVRVAFDRALDPSAAKAAVGRLIPFEEETSVVRQAKPRRPSRVEPSASLKGTLRIVAARVGGEGRSLLLVTDPHPRAATYSLHLMGIRAPDGPAPGEAFDLLYGLGGVEAAWDVGAREGVAPTYSGWWPDLEPGVVRRLMNGSAEHERALALLARPGRLVLRTLVVLPKGRFALRLASDGPIEAVLGAEKRSGVEEPGGGRVVAHVVESNGGPIALEVSIPTGKGRGTALRASYHKVEDGADAREVHLDRSRLLLPWAATTPPLPHEPPGVPRGMAGGDPVRGESIFFGAQARCSVCHAIGGKGGTVGPELGHQFERPPGEVYRDLVDPAAWINPNYATFDVALEDGRTLTGTVRADGADAVRVVDRGANATVVRRDRIEQVRPNPTSIMPHGLPAALGDGPFRDLLSFLTGPPHGSR